MIPFVPANGVGAVAGGTGAVSPAIPSAALANDILLLFVESANDTGTASAPTGWTQVHAAQGTGASAGLTSTRLEVYWKRHSGTETAPSVADRGDHTAAYIMAVRGCLESATPIDVTNGDTGASSTSVSIPGATSTVADALVVAAVAWATDASTGQSSGQANAALSGVAEAADTGTTQGNGGGITVITGGKAAAGAYGTTTATLGTASVQGRISFALKPQSGPKIVGTSKFQAVQGTTASVTRPPEAATGDLLVLAIGHEGIGAPAITPPAGWTELDDSAPNTNTRMAIYWRFDDGSAGPFSFTWDGSNTFRWWRCVAVRDVDPTTPWSDFDFAYKTGGANPSTTAAAVTSTPTTDNNLLLYMLNVDGATSLPWTQPTSFAKVDDVTNAIYTATLRQTTAASSGSLGATVSASTYGNEGMVWALQPVQPADVTAPVLTVLSGPTRSKISDKGGVDASDFVWEANEALQAYKIKVVSASNAAHTTGTQIESGGAVAAGQDITITITDDELLAAAGEGTWIVKAFGQDLAGNWST